MFEVPEQLEKELDHVRLVRAELQVHVHFGSVELRDRWDRLDRGWQHLEWRLEGLANESDQIAQEICETLLVLAEQLRDGYERIKTVL